MSMPKDPFEDEDPKEVFGRAAGLSKEERRQAEKLIKKQDPEARGLHAD